LALSLGCSDSTNGAAPDAAASTTTDGAGTSEVGATDSGGGDAGADGAATDASSDADGSDAQDHACHPGDIAGFVPPPYAGVRSRSQACAAWGGDGGLVQAYANACLAGPATYESCTTFAPPDAAGAQDCYNCLTSPGATDGGVGGVTVNLNNVVVVDYGGCIDVIDPTDAGASCAVALAASTLCTVYACRACPVTDITSHDRFLACTNEANTGVCSGFGVTSAACVAGERGDGGTVVNSTCFPGHPFDNYLSFAQYLCGAP
jgi:hypothetical protein